MTEFTTICGNERGLKIRHILSNRQFESISKHTKPECIMLGITRHDKHVPEFTRTINERVWTFVNTLQIYTPTYSRNSVQSIVLAELFSSHKWYRPNAKLACNSNQVTYRLSKMQFGTYVQVNKQHNNSLLSDTTGIIAQQSLGNAQCSYKFVNLYSRNCIVRNNWYGR